MSGKGSRPRPFSVTQETFSKNWDLIFKTKNKISEKNSTESNNKNHDEESKNNNQFNDL